jgi:4-alpha-glucanotransferase
VSARASGLMVPLFSMASTRSWGIGEFADLPVFARWLEAGAQRFVQILPISELPDSESSPYSALTAMALDPTFIAVPDVEDFVATGGESALSAEDRRSLEELRTSTRVAYRQVRALKGRALRRAYRQFVEFGQTDAVRAERFAMFAADHAAWLDDYALFQALRARYDRLPWWDWDPPLARRDEPALQRARAELADEIGYRKYVQWIAAEQWAGARRDAAPLRIFGDVPFMISADSPDVWGRQREFRFDATVGVPPDAFSETGQDWGLPPWRWDVMAENDFEWMRTRANRNAELFDGFRLDHLVGLYRTYVRPLDQATAPFFAPPDEAAQTSLGERLVSLYVQSGAEIIAEDLGTVPDFVRASLRRLRVPGFKVLRWERQWKEDGQPYIDPTEYDETSVATTGTHDTEPLVTWWQSLTHAEQADVLKMPSVQRRLAESPAFDAMLRALLDARSRLAIIPFQDLFGMPDRINTPAQVNDENWCWMLPWRVDRLLDVDEARTRAAMLARWTRDAKR